MGKNNLHYKLSLLILLHLLFIMEGIAQYDTWRRDPTKERTPIFKTKPRKVAAQPDSADIMVFLVRMLPKGSYLGRIIAEDQQQLTLVLADNDTIILNRQEVRSAVPMPGSKLKNGKYYPYHIQATQAAFSNNAYGLKKGEITYHNNMLLINRVNIGLSDELNMATGVALAPFIPYIGLRLNMGSEEKKLGMAAGVSLLFNIADKVSVIESYLMVTMGSRDANISLKAGIAKEFGTVEPGLMLGVNLNLRTGPKGYFFLESKYSKYFDAGMVATGYRQMIGLASVNFGVVGVAAFGFIPLPNIGITVPLRYQD